MQAVVNIEYLHLSPLKSKCFLHDLYIVKGLSISQIARDTFSSRASVRKYLKLHQIPMRHAYQHHSRPAQPRYGRKSHRVQLIEHKYETQIIGAVIELHNEGLTLRQIANTLTSLRIPTKIRGKAWHPEMIRRILNNT